MFFKLRNNNGFQFKFASYAKIPYAGNKIYFSKSDYGSLNNVYNTIHYIKKEDYVTYFYSKNNAINYYRKSNNDSIIFTQDFENSVYQVFKLKADKYSIKGENSLLIKTEDGKYYVVDKDEYLVVFNESDNKIIYEVPVSDRLYCNYFYPIANVILPVVEITADGISVTLCNLANQEVHTISWGLEYIKELINSIKYNLDNYNVDEISYLKLNEIYYMYDTNDRNLSYLKGVKIAFEINALYLSVKIELNVRDIICYLGMRDVYIRTSNDRATYYNEFFQDLDPFVKKYQFDGKIRNNCLSSFVFDNDCYYVRRDSCGLTYMKKGEYYEDICKTSAIYIYKNYWIIINHSNSYRNRKVAIIDMKRRLMSVWANIHEGAYCIQDHIVFYYYLTRSDKLIFLSTDLDCISIIDGTQVEHFFSKKEHLECRKEKYRNITEIVQFYNVDRLIIQAVSRAYNIVFGAKDIKPITHYMDKKSDKLYIISRYRIDYTVHFGLFLLEILDNDVNLVLVYDKIETGQYVEFNKFENRAKYTRSIEKMNLYRISEKYSTTLDLMYGHGQISSIKYNRRSLVFREFEEWDFYYGSAEYSSSGFDYNSENLVVVGYWRHGKHNKVSPDYPKFCLILTELSLICKMQVVKA